MIRSLSLQAKTVASFSPPTTAAEHTDGDADLQISTAAALRPNLEMTEGKNDLDEGSADGPRRTVKTMKFLRMFSGPAGRFDGFASQLRKLGLEAADWEEGFQPFSV